MPRITAPYVCLLAFWIFASFVSPSLAQTSKLFQWGFGNEALSTSIPTCFPMSIVVKSFDPTTNSTNGTPPYYMLSFAIGGTPVTTLIGTDENNLSWTVTQPVGSRLLLNVVDANGSSGGVPPQLFTVIAGQTTECVTTPLTTPPFTVTANVTTDLTTCQPWGLTVKGGVPPYTVTLAELNDPIITNVTMPFGLDLFTFIDRAHPNGQLMAAISDFTGRWANGTALVNTQGSTNNSCVGLVSSSGNSTLVQQQEDASQSTGRRRSAVTVVAVILVLLVLMGLGGAAILLTRKRKREAQVELAQALPTQYVEPESKTLSIINSLDFSPDRPVSGKAALVLQEAQNSNPASEITRSLSSQPLPTTTPLYYPARSASANARLTNPTDVQRPNNRVSNSGFVNFPATSIRRSAKSSEASMTSTRAPNSEYPEAGAAPSRTQGARVGDEVVFQHRDGGIVRELPPPYRARRSPPASS